MRDLVKKFQRIIIETATEEDDAVANVIADMYDKLLSEATKSYEESHFILQPMIGGMTANPKACFSFQLKRFYRKMNEWRKGLKVFEDDIENSPYIKSGQNYDIYRFFESKSNFPQQTRLADVDSSLVKNLNREEKKQLFSTLVQLLENPQKLLNDDDVDVDTMSLLLPLIRSVAISDGILPLFYQAIYEVVDRINHSEWNQAARNRAEDCLECAYKDEMPQYGFLGLIKLFAIQNDINGTLLYANCLMESLKRIKLCPKSFVFEFLWSVMKLYRTIGMRIGIRIGIYTDDIKSCFDELDFSVTKTLFFYNTYYNTKALELPSTIQFEIETFLNKYRESIFHLGEHSAAPWYVLIKQIEQKNSYLSQTLKEYLKQFRMMLPKETLDSIVMNAVNKTDTYASLKESITKLMITRDDQNYDIDSTITVKLAKQLLPIAHQEKSQEKMLTAMAVLNDFSFVRKPFGLDKKINPLEVMPIERDKIESIYANPNGPISILRNIKDDSFIWIAEGEEGSYITTKHNQNFEFNFFENVRSADFRKSKASVQSKLIFDTYDENHYYKDIKSYEDEAIEINQGLSTSYFDFPHAQRLMFAKDSSYAFYPHQLFLNSKEKRLYAEDYPTANFISTEFFLQNIDNCKVNGSLTKAFWSPKALDMLLEKSYSHLSDIFKRFEIEIYAEESQLKDYYPIKPLNSSINILCAHGSEKGKDAHCFSAGDVKFPDIGKIVSKGELLILFACHSGSMDNSNFDNAIHTMIKTFIRAGYQAVIAPMWALSTEILPNWLETFMTYFEEGDFVVDALYKANMAVKEQYPTPSAWANLHLFGNPYLHVQK